MSLQASKLLAEPGQNRDPSESVHAKLQVATIKLKLGQFREAVLALQEILTINNSWVFVCGHRPSNHSSCCLLYKFTSTSYNSCCCCWTCSFNLPHFLFRKMLKLIPAGNRTGVLLLTSPTLYPLSCSEIEAQDYYRFTLEFQKPCRRPWTSRSRVNFTSFDWRSFFPHNILFIPAINPQAAQLRFIFYFYLLVRCHTFHLSREKSVGIEPKLTCFTSEY